MRSSADRASPWMSYTHIPLLGLLSLFDVTCSLTSFQKWSMSPIALHIAFIRMWYTFVVGLPGRTCVSCWLLETSSWSLHLSFGLMHLIAAKSFLFQLYGCHLRNPSLEINTDYTCVHPPLGLVQGCSKIQLHHLHSSSLRMVSPFCLLGLETFTYLIWFIIVTFLWTNFTYSLGMLVRFVISFSLIAFMLINW